MCVWHYLLFGHLMFFIICSVGNLQQATFKKSPMCCWWKSLWWPTYQDKFTFAGIKFCNTPLWCILVIISLFLAVCFNFWPSQLVFWFFIIIKGVNELSFAIIILFSFFDQAYFSHLELPVTDYATDLKSVLDQSIRIIQAMIDISANSGWLSSAFTCLHLMQMVMQVCFSPFCTF